MHPSPLPTEFFDMFRRLDKATFHVSPYGLANVPLKIIWSHNSWRTDQPFSGIPELVVLAEIADILEE